MSLSPVPISIPMNYNFGIGIIQPAQAPASLQTIKEQKVQPTVNSLEILNLVNVGNNVLNVPSFLEEHPILQNNLDILTSIIKNERKKGSAVEFRDDGRIKISEELFSNIIETAKKTTSAGNKPQIVKLS